MQVRKYISKISQVFIDAASKTAPQTTFTKFFNKADASLVVTHIVACASPISPEDPKSRYHWFLSLAITPETGVKLDILPVSADGRTGVIVITSRPEDMPKLETDRTFPMSVIQGQITVQELIDLIKRHKRDRYIYDDTGSGCRYWLSHVIEDFMAEKVVAEGTSDALQEYIAQLATNEGTDRVPMPALQGIFY